MTVAYNTVKEIYNRNFGSMELFMRGYFKQLLYTEGVMDFQKTLNAYWVVDNVIAYMPKILQAFKDNEFTFFVVEITLNRHQQGYMEVYTEDFVQGIYDEHISIIKQDIPFIDLPTKEDDEITTYRFFLELSAIDPVTYTLLLPGEH